MILHLSALRASEDSNMKNYEILATHRVYRRYRVPADSEAEAEQRLRDVYYEGAEDPEIRLLEERNKL